MRALGRDVQDPPIIRRIRRDDLDKVIAAFRVGGPEKHTRRVERQDDGEVEYLTAWWGDEPVGHLLVVWGGTSEEHVASRVTDCPCMEDLLVSPTWRRQGIGTRLIAVAESHAQLRHFPRIGLAVALDNPDVRRLYERLGYQDAGLGPFVSQWEEADRTGRRVLIEETVIFLVKSLEPEDCAQAD